MLNMSHLLPVRGVGASGTQEHIPKEGKLETLQLLTEIENRMLDLGYDIVEINEALYGHPDDAFELTEATIYCLCFVSTSTL